MNLFSSGRLVTVRKMDQDEFVLGLRPINPAGQSTMVRPRPVSICCLAPAQLQTIYLLTFYCFFCRYRYIVVSFVCSIFFVFLFSRNCIQNSLYNFNLEFYRLRIENADNPLYHTVRVVASVDSIRLYQLYVIIV